MPLIRYRTGDLVVKIPGRQCACGRSFDIFEGGIRGRVDDMKVVRGTNVYPAAVEAIVREFREVDEFLIHLYRLEDSRDEIEVLIEISASPETHPRIVRRLESNLRDAHGGLRFEVREASPNSLPRYELKARRVLDER